MSSDENRLAAKARHSASPGSHSRPASASTTPRAISGTSAERSTRSGASGATISGKPPIGVTTDGVPAASASTTVSPNPSSAVVGITLRSAAR